MIDGILATLMGLFTPDPVVVQGYVEGDYLYVGPVTAGEIIGLSVNEGEGVSRGAPLFTQDATKARAAVASARAALAEAEAHLADMEKGKRPEEMAALAARLEAARAALALSTVSRDRARALVARGAASRESLDEAEEAYLNDRAVLDERAQDHDLGLKGERVDLILAQRAAVDRARSDLTAAEKDLADRTRTAPVDGQVVDIFHRVGEVVAQGTPVLSLLPPDRVKIVFFVPEAVLGGLTLGMDIPFACDGCAPDLTARLSKIGDGVEYTPPVIYSVKFRSKLVVRVEATPTGDALALRPGQPVDIDPAALPGLVEEVQP
jgi:HlyD family secretion protein